MVTLIVPLALATPLNIILHLKSQESPCLLSFAEILDVFVAVVEPYFNTGAVVGVYQSVTAAPCTTVSGLTLIESILGTSVPASLLILNA